MKQRSMTQVGRPAAPGTQAVHRALAVLDVLGSARAETGLSEIAVELELGKATVFRLLGALERQGFVTRSPERQTYCLGPALIRLGAQARRATGLHDAAHAMLKELAAETGETATLEVLVGDEVLILDEVQGHRLVACMPEVGTRWPAHATSTGKVLLAAARFEGGALPRHGGGAQPRLARLTPSTIVSRAALERELAKVWRRGFAVALEELDPGFVAVGAAVRNQDGRVGSAISIGGPVSRFGRERIASLGPVVRKAANRISARLGAPPGPVTPDLPIPARSTRSRPAVR